MISVIVPVYNVSRYIKKCIISILSQTYNDFELLLIDDGSTDKSGIICDYYQKQDDRIKVFHKENGGLSDARNYGIERAIGDYVTFIDSDDYVASNYLETLFQLIIKYDADVSSVCFIETNNRELDVFKNIDGTGCLTNIDAIKYSMIRKKLGVSACGKLFKIGLFKEIKFPKNQLYEDLFTIPYIFAKSGRIAYTEDKLYAYYMRSGSITNSNITSKHLQFFSNAQHLIKLFDANMPDVHDYLVARYVTECIKRFAEVLLFSKDYNSLIYKIKYYCDLYWREGVLNPYVAKTIKIQVLILHFNPFLYRFIFYPYKKLKYMRRGKKIK